MSETVKLAIRLRAYGLGDADFFVAKVYPGTALRRAVNSFQAEKRLDDRQVYEHWSAYDWESVTNVRVAAKLGRFNDIPRISMNPLFDSLSLRRVVRNAYEMFFNPDVTEADVDRLLWTGVP